MNNFFVTLKFIVIIIIKKDLFVKITERPKKKTTTTKIINYNKCAYIYRK
jgi:hypothetical protein